MMIIQDIFTLWLFNSTDGRYSSPFVMVITRRTLDTQMASNVYYLVLLRSLNIFLGFMFMLSCRLGIYFKDYVTMLRAYEHSCADIALGHILCKWIIMALDSSYNYVIIISDMIFLWQEFTPASASLCTWHAQYAIQFPLWIIHCCHDMLHLETVLFIHYTKRYFLSIASSAVDICYKLM